MSCYWLNNADFVKKMTVNNNVLLYEYRKNGKPVTFAWCLEGTTSKLLRPNTYPVIDIFGNPVSVTILGEEPVIFSATADRVAELFGVNNTR